MANDLVEYDGLLKHILLYARGKLKWKIETLPEEYLYKSLEELEKEQKITTTDKKLRLLLHQEIQRAAKDNDNINITNICRGVCHVNSFLTKLDDPKKVAWLLLPYQEDRLRIIHQVNEAHEAIESLLHIDIHRRDEFGKVIGLDHKAAELKFKAAKLLYDRAYPATQKISYTSEDTAGKDKIEDLDEKIKFLEEKLDK